MKILFLCIANSARSQMAEGLAKQIFGDHALVISAGTKPSMVHPYAIKVMAEIGIDISQQHSKFIDSIDIEDVTHIITLCKEEICPHVSSKAVHEHWIVEDPTEPCGDEEEQIEQFRQIRDELHQKIMEWNKRLL